MQSDQLFNELHELIDELLTDNKWVKLKVGGYSMFPFFKNGEIITIKKCPASELVIGDVVVFKIRDKWIAHRLIKIQLIDNKKILITKGDSCKKIDSKFAEECIIGKVVSFSKNHQPKSLETKYYKIIGRIMAQFSTIVTPFIVALLWLVLRVMRVYKSIKNVFKSMFFICRDSRRIAFVNILISVFQGVLPFVIIYLIKRLVDAISVVNSYTDKIDAYKVIGVIIVVTGIAFLAQSILSIIGNEIRVRLTQSITMYIYRLLHKKYSSLEMAYIEDANQQDVIHRAVQEAGFRPIKMVNESLSVVQSLASWLFIAVILFTIHWAVFFLIIIAVLPGFLIRIKYSKKFYNLNKENSPKEREAHYYNRILTGLPFAKELRLFGLENFFTGRFNNIQKDLYHKKNKLSRKQAIADIYAQTFAIVVIFLSFGFVAYLGVNGSISIGTVVLFFLIFQRGFSVMKDLFQSIAGLFGDNVFINDFFYFLKFSPLQELSEVKETIAPLQKGIVVENVSFHYPSSQRQALQSISLQIPAGKTVALVGANGSGKTTLVKLLCGFYTPQQGRILFDNIDISSINPDEIREQISAVFQDFALYNLTAKENIALGMNSKPINDSEIEQSASNSGIAEVLAKLPNGYDSLLGNLFEKGEELSIGQWQKIAIAKAFYRNTPILFMDEPSSALDAETELHILNNLKLLAKDKTTLIISHRFSTIKWVDVIYVLDEGVVVESGDHEKLMALEGKYFNMYQHSVNK
ncbi:MAG: signal peptidase I [Bacteroidota bacterium]